MSIFKSSRCIPAIALMAATGATLIGAQAAELPCGHPDSAPTVSAKIKIESWKEPRLVQEFKKFGQRGNYVYFDGPLYVPVAGMPEQPKIFKSWQIQKSFESPAQFFILDINNSSGDGVYTLRMYRCATAQAWEPVWKSWMEVVDTQVVVEHMPAP